MMKVDSFPPDSVQLASQLEDVSKKPKRRHRRKKRSAKQDTGNSDTSNNNYNTSNGSKQTKKASRRSVPRHVKSHPLQHTWVLWQLKPDRKKPWMERLQSIARVSTVEEFWALYNVLHQPSKLAVASDYHLFKEGISPMWEDPSNEHGGRWVAKINRASSDGTPPLDDCWLELLMAAVGEQFDDPAHYINGVAVSRRKGEDKVALWTNLLSKSEARAVGHTMSQKLGLGVENDLHFELHKDAYERDKSTKKRARPKVSFALSSPN